MNALRLCLALAASLLMAACAASGAGGREVNITQAEDGCTPLVIDATPGEKLNLMVKNESSDDYEVEGIDGTKLEEVIVPEGRTRSVGYNVPDSGGVFKIKCYVPGGTATIIEVRAGEGSQNTAPAGQGQDPTEAPESDATVEVVLDEFTIEPDAPSVPGGRIRFVANNSGEIIHELYVLREKDDGGFDVAGEIENVAPGATGSMVLELEPGRYQLACLITVGEAGSTVDHFKEGMYTNFTVE